VVSFSRLALETFGLATIRFQTDLTASANKMRRSAENPIPLVFS